MVKVKTEEEAQPDAAEGSGTSASADALQQEQDSQDGLQDWPEVQWEDGQAEIPAELWERLMKMVSDASVKKDF